MIDLHTHTTASDGWLSPAELIAAAWDAGVRTLSVTDHDTVASLPEVSALAASRGITFVTGIEVTAVLENRDVHMLGYFFDHRSRDLAEFLRGQREDRLRRLRAVCDRLADLGMLLPVETLLESVRAGAGHAAGRPIVARAMVKAGYVADANEAFERWIGDGRPACAPRVGAPPADVVDLIGKAGGIVSLAHPGLLRRDELIPGLAAHGLAALEIYHSEHDAVTTARYRSLASAHGLDVSGGSDFHGSQSHRRATLGAVSLPADDFARLRARAESR